jgi:hypothetical protein
MKLANARRVSYQLDDFRVNAPAKEDVDLGRGLVIVFL